MAQAVHGSYTEDLPIRGESNMPVVRRVIHASAFLFMTLCSSAWSQIASVDVSPDITLDLGGTLTADEGVSNDDFAGPVTPVDLGPIPVNADVTHFHLMDNGDRLFGLDITVSLPGPLVVTPIDVVLYDGVNYSLWFDGSAENLPSGVRFDAMSLDAQGDLVLSFDTTVTVDGITVADEDIVKFDGANFLSVLDSSMVGVPEGTDVDALHFDAASGDLFVSFDIAGIVDNIAFADEDLLKLEQGTNVWSMVYDGSAEHLAWGPGDLDAVFVTFLVGFIFKDGFEAL